MATFKGSTDIDATGYKRLGSITVSDTTADPGAAGVVNVRGGSDAGDIYLVLNVAALGNSWAAYPEPLYIPEGIYVEVASGDVQVAIQASK